MMDFVCLNCHEEAYDLERGDPCPVCEEYRLFPITYTDSSTWEDPEDAGYTKVSTTVDGEFTIDHYTKEN